MFCPANKGTSIEQNKKLWILTKTFHVQVADYLLQHNILLQYLQDKDNNTEMPML